METDEIFALLDVAAERSSKNKAPADLGEVFQHGDGHVGADAVADEDGRIKMGNRGNDACFQELDELEEAGFVD